MSAAYENAIEAYEQETHRFEQDEKLRLLDDLLYEAWLDSLEKK